MCSSDLGAITPGDFFSFTAAVALLYGPVRQLSRIVNTVQQSTSSVERVFEVLDLPPAITDRSDAVALDAFRHALAFDQVSFRHEDSDELTLRDISLTVARGEVVAFVGMSGAGKSTLMDLLPRFHDVSAGRITLDGHDLRDVTQATRATITARLLDGRRVGGIDHGRYTCTRPARREYVTFGADRRLIARELGRDGGRVRLRVTLQMTNANGLPATVRRVVVVTRHP